MHPLDEVQENINQWTKRILLGPDEDSWRQHSSNVACSHMCINFEEVQFVKSQLDYGDGVKHKDKYHSLKTVVPKLVAERQRLYEWVLAMFLKEVPGRKCSFKDGFDLIPGLRSNITVPVTPNNNIDGLDECIISMFGESDELENTELQIHDDYNNIPEGRADSNSNANGSDTTINRNTVDKVSLGNVFEQGRKKMIEMKIPMVRERKQK